MLLDNNRPSQMLQYLLPKSVQRLALLFSHVVMVDAFALIVDFLIVSEVVHDVSDLGVHHLPEDVDVDFVFIVLHWVSREGCEISISVVH
jgi:hypothetical protein